ncbi:MAG: response regulator transcription factor [Vicinamibacterales bacterium]
MIRVLIVASTWLYREGLAQLLAAHDAFTVVGTAADRHQAAVEIRERQPGVVLLDLATPESAAIIRELKALAPEVPIVAIAVPDLEADVLSTIESGVTGYLSRDGSLTELLTVIKSAARGELQCSPRIAGVLLRRIAALAAEHDRAAASTGQHERLTIRERQIVSLIEQNLSNKEIAQHLGIEVATVKNHVHNVLEKLNLRRRVDVGQWLSSRRESVSPDAEEPAKR